MNIHQQLEKDFEKAMTKRLWWYEKLMRDIPQKKSVKFMQCNICELFEDCSTCKLYPCFSDHRLNLMRSICWGAEDVVFNINLDHVKRHYKFLLKLLKSKGYTYE